MDIKSIFGANLKYYRKKRKLSQEELAEKVDISTKHLSTIETGSSFVSTELLEKLTQTLSVSASVLFFSADEKSVDDSFFSLVDQAVEEELQKAVKVIRKRIREKDP